MRLVGAGLGRTGTLSLKQALEHLLGAPCYHMMETFGRPADIPVWHRAVNGEMPDWPAFLADYDAAVDWPVAGFWRETSAAFPEAVVLLSTRPTDDWWTSASNTIFQISRREIPLGEDVAAAQIAMARDMLTKRFTPNWTDETEAKAALRRAQRRCARRRANRPARGVAPRRRLAAALRRARRFRPRRAVPPREHHGRLPRHDRPRRVAPAARTRSVPGSGRGGRRRRTRRDRSALPGPTRTDRGRKRPRAPRRRPWRARVRRWTPTATA